VPCPDISKGNSKRESKANGAFELLRNIATRCLGVLLVLHMWFAKKTCKIITNVSLDFSASLSVPCPHNYSRITEQIFMKYDIAGCFCLLVHSKFRYNPSTITWPANKTYTRMYTCLRRNSFKLFQTEVA
jgi:hypothetical protein